MNGEMRPLIITTLRNVIIRSVSKLNWPELSSLELSSLESCFLLESLAGAHVCANDLTGTGVFRSTSRDFLIAPLICELRALLIVHYPLCSVPSVFLAGHLSAWSLPCDYCVSFFRRMKLQKCVSPILWMMCEGPIRIEILEEQTLTKCWACGSKQATNAHIDRGDSQTDRVSAL